MCCDIKLGGVYRILKLPAGVMCYRMLPDTLLIVVTRPDEQTDQNHFCTGNS